MLSNEIFKELNQISHEFSAFQEKNGLTCIEKCGKCCFKPDIYCSPLELLPLALELLSRGEAQSFHDQCVEREEDRCIFLNVENEEKYQGKCTEYFHRPLVCRTFGVSARHGKNERIDYSVCKTIQDEHSDKYYELLAGSDVPPFIDVSKNRLTTLDPHFLEEHLINKSMRIILEKILLHSLYSTTSL